MTSVWTVMLWRHFSWSLCDHFLNNLCIIHNNGSICILLKFYDALSIMHTIRRCDVFHKANSILSIQGSRVYSTEIALIKITNDLFNLNVIRQSLICYVLSKLSNVLKSTLNTSTFPTPIFVLNFPRNFLFKLLTQNILAKYYILFVQISAQNKDSLTIFE